MLPLHPTNERIRKVKSYLSPNRNDVRSVGSTRVGIDAVSVANHFPFATGKPAETASNNTMSSATYENNNILHYYSF